MNDQAHNPKAYKSPKGFKSVSEARKILVISNSTFYKYAASGGIKVTKILGKNFVSDDEISRILKGE
jgi:predicted site-specific integrase-resolvase